MAVGITTTKTTGKLIFELERDEEKTTRSIDVPFPKTDTSSETLQSAIDSINTAFTTASSVAANYIVQPANWRDTNTTEEQWTTTRVYYEITTTSSTPVEPTTE